MMENLVSIDPTDHQSENVDADRLKKLLVLEVVGILDNPEKDFLFGDREKANFLWCLLRYCSSPKQIVPSWTGFNISVHEGTPILQSRIHYLDFIDAPAAETSTIYQVCLAIRFSKNYAKLFFSMKRWYRS